MAAATYGSAPPPPEEDPNKPKNVYANSSIPTWASDAANDASKVGNWIGNTLFPSTNTPDPNTSQPGQDNRDFYQGLGDQRDNFQRGAGEQLIEGTAGPGQGGAGNTWIDPRARDAQIQALGMEQQAAEGNTPSAAEQLYRKGMDESAGSQLGFAATQQGSNPGQALRLGLAAGQGAYAKSAADAAGLRAQEIANARHDYAATSTAARGQTQDLAKANQESQQRQYALDNQFYLGLTDAQQKAQQAALDAEKQKTQNDVNARAGNQGTLGKLFGAAGALIGS